MAIMPSLVLGSTVAADAAILRRQTHRATLTTLATQTTAGGFCRYDARPNVADGALQGVQTVQTRRRPAQQQHDECKNLRCNNNNSQHWITSLISRCVSLVQRCNYKFLLKLFLCLIFLLLAVESGLPTASAATNPRVPHRRPRTEPGVCGSIDVRNECETFEQLHNCTVIRGFLLMVMVPTQYDSPEKCDFEKYTFPLLREITDFVILHDVRGLRSLRQLFPNLAVIRGRRLFLNYALGITTMPDLEALEFPSLIAIQRGHIYVNNCPKLCNVDKIDFDRITLTVGENNVYTMPQDDCANKTVCNNCLTDHCWSNDVCQRFENDNIAEPGKGIHHCHSECLGGCYNTTNRGCYVCQNIEDHGECVKECPEGKYLMEIYQLCYTEEECKSQNMTISDNKCVMDCPENTIFDINGRDFLGCIPCDLERSNHVFTIFSLAEAHRLRGCSGLNASVIISLRNTVNEEDLVRSLGNLHYIGGYLKIIGSEGLTSLRFLKGLKKIANNPELLDGGVYGLVIYDNENLKDLWQPQKNFEIVHGSIYMQMNQKLCNRKVSDFRRKVIHDILKDEIQVNDQEVLCNPAKLKLNAEVWTYNSIKLSWPKDQTSSEVEIMYRPIEANQDFVEHSELDTHICNRVKWTRILTFPKELSSNQLYYIYIVENLMTNTRYALLVKTFGLEDSQDSRSDVQYITTNMDLPGPPSVNVTQITEDSLTLQIKAVNDKTVSHFMVEMYEHPDNDSLLKYRDYCLEPSYVYHEGETPEADDDQDTCCARKEEEANDWRFTQNMQKHFECKFSNLKNCPPDRETPETAPGTTPKLVAISRGKVDTSLSNALLVGHLMHYRLYTFQVQACNTVGCGAYTLIWSRTNFSESGERLLELRACRVANFNEFHVHFPEPQNPNGLITSYVVHFRLKVPGADKFKTHIECMSQRQLMFNEQHMIAQLKEPFNEVAVRVYSLAGGVLSEWVPITVCAFKDSNVQIGTASRKDSYLKGYSGIIVAICFVLTFTTLLVWSCCKYDWRRWRNFRIIRIILGPMRNWQVLRADQAAERMVEFRNVRESGEDDEEGEQGEVIGQGEEEQLASAAT